MNKFGLLKNKILHNLTEAYATGNKKEVKEILKLIKENNDFKELFMFYDDVENIYIADKEIATLYVENVEKLLKEKRKKIVKFYKTINNKISNEILNENEIYNYLDIISEEDNLKNIDKKIEGKKKLIEHITTKKNIIEPSKLHTNNENLLRAVLVNNFNTEFEKSLTEEEKIELKKLLSISNDEISKKFNILKEDVSSKLNTILKEEKNSDLKEKLKHALNETNQMKSSKYNYYKLQQLKNGI